MPAMTTAALRTLMDIAVVKAGFLNNAVVAGEPETLFLVKDKNVKGKRLGVACDVYNIKNMASPVATADPDESLFSYIVDYAPGETNHQILGTGADFCFTVTINGCTFALGTPAEDGTILVSHTNMKKTGSGKTDIASASGGIDYSGPHAAVLQEIVQTQVAKQMHGTGTLIGPSQYYNPAKTNNLTVFGMRGAAGWTFHYQSYRYQAGFFHLEGVHDFAANSVAI